MEGIPMSGAAGEACRWTGCVAERSTWWPSHLCKGRRPSPCRLTGGQLELATMSRHLISRRTLLGSCAAVSSLVAVHGILRAQSAPISVGFVTGQTGPGASIGIPYSKGIAAAIGHIDSVAGHKIRLV